VYQLLVPPSVTREFHTKVLELLDFLQKDNLLVRIVSKTMLMMRDKNNFILLHVCKLIPQINGQHFAYVCFVMDISCNSVEMMKNCVASNSR